MADCESVKRVKYRIGPGSVTNVNVIKDCTNVQVGTSNVITKYNAAPTAISKKEQNIKRTKNIAGIHVVTRVLESTSKPIAFSDLEKEVKDQASSLGLNSFPELSGWPLRDFLLLNKDVFEITTIKRRKYIQMRTQQTVKNTALTNGALLDNSDTSNENDIRESNVLTNKDEWTVIQSKRSLKKDRLANKSRITVASGSGTVDRMRVDTLACEQTCSGSSSDEHEDISDYPTPSDEMPTFDQTSFVNLLLIGESMHVIFVDSLGKYENDQLKFSVDLVSLWNTPQRPKSYILIGVASKNELNGVDREVDNLYFKSMFQTEVFTMEPVFTSFQVTYDSMVFYVIEVASSRGHGHPSIVKKACQMQSSVVKEEELWVRNDLENIVVKPSSLTSGSVYQWFLDQGEDCQRQTAFQLERRGVVHSPELGTPSNTVPVSPQSHFEDEECDIDLEVNHGNTFDFFLSTMNGFTKGHFVLLSGDVSCTQKQIGAFGLVPWLCVYDFDIFSCTDGLLNAVQDSLQKKRNLTTFSWNETPDNISERGTRWCFMRGRNDISSTRTDCRNGDVENVNVWFKQVVRGIEANCEKVSSFAEDYTILTIVLLWPQNEQLVAFLTKFMARLNDTLACSPNIVLCMNKSKPSTKSGSIRFRALCEEYRETLQICFLDFEIIGSGLQHVETSHGNEAVVYSLPWNVESSTTKAFISETEATWLAEDFDVLFLDVPYSVASFNSEDIDKEVTNFYKGGTLPWYAWYNDQAEQAVIERDIEKDLEERIHKSLSDCKTSTITLLHAPGAGGTTLAQKVMWKFHKTIPCIQMKLRTATPLDEVTRKVAFIHDKTELPVLLLVDAEEESKVKRLSRHLRNTVILYVKRCTVKFQTKSDRLFLSGNVTVQESKDLESKFGEKCTDDTSKKRHLELLTKEVMNNQSHCMYEYGMTVYLHEFKGLISYVEGYLQLGTNIDIHLTPSQLCLGYLALVYYYGHTSVPCQFFASLFMMPQNYIMDLDDFPSPIREFVVYDKNEGRQNNIRICHFIVAKEILEQILVRHSNVGVARSDTLSLPACRCLSHLCITFIDYAGQKKTRNTTSSSVRFILTKTFIFRDEKDINDNEEPVRRKPVLSKLMKDIVDGPPMFTERLRILRRLVEAFPDDPNFRAHLGRFYAFCRPDEEHEAEKCFQHAVKLCDEQIKGRSGGSIDDGTKQTMMHVYHMYGNVKKRCIEKMIGNFQRGSLQNKSESFSEQMDMLINNAEEACEYFTKSRDVTPQNHDVYTYAYIGEIQVRLQICEFVNRQFQTPGDNTIVAFLKSNANQRAKTFVHKSISCVVTLVMECYTDVVLLNKDLQSLRKQIHLYNTLFKHQVVPLETFSSDDTVDSRRVAIAAKMLKFGKTGTSLNGIDGIDDEKEIREIIQLYEENFADVQKYGFQNGSSKKDLEWEFRDWIHAIRHDQLSGCYSLEDALQHVLFWNDTVTSPISLFYAFSIYSLLGFGTETTPGKTDCLIEALELREKLIRMNNLIIRPRYPREWLGSDGEGMKRLKSGNRHVGIGYEDRTSSCRADIAVCKGTICRPNTSKVRGMLSMDLGVKTVDVRVFFIPVVVNLDGGRFAGQRVEFNLAFTIQHGFEAYNVKLLKRHGCSACSRKLEFSSNEMVKTCRCGNQVHRDHMNQVK